MSDFFEKIRDKIRCEMHTAVSSECSDFFYRALCWCMENSENKSTLFNLLLDLNNSDCQNSSLSIVCGSFQSAAFEVFVKF